jgi:hypothetical protein
MNMAVHTESLGSLWSSWQYSGYFRLGVYRRSMNSSNPVFTPICCAGSLLCRKLLYVQVERKSFFAILLFLYTSTKFFLFTSCANCSANLLSSEFVKLRNMLIFCFIMKERVQRHFGMIFNAIILSLFEKGNVHRLCLVLKRRYSGVVFSCR